MDPRIILLFSPTDRMHELLRPTTSTGLVPIRRHAIADPGPSLGTGDAPGRSARHIVTRLRRAIDRARELFRGGRSRPCVNC